MDCFICDTESMVKNCSRNLPNYVKKVFAKKALDMQFIIIVVIIALNKATLLVVYVGESDWLFWPLCFDDSQVFSAQTLPVIPNCN